ncbi:hypothetical protein ACO0LD_03855 [Undibacterium sp. Ji83W]|uniref:hypothetical protein n=1 Tax=Undibacterium sp. Ji83W TaxID=3413043 RepID=UPI003BF3B930
MDNLDFLAAANLIHACTDIELQNLFSEIHSFIEQEKSKSSWIAIKNSSDFIAFEKALQHRILVANDEAILTGCLSILTISEMVSDVQFIIETLALSARKLRQADAVLYAAVRYALSADLMDDDSYVEACGGLNMNAMECDKHLRVAEKILHPLGISTTV